MTTIQADSDWDDDQEVPAEPVRAFFSDEMLPGPADVFQAAKENGLDFLKIRANLGLDFYDCIKLVNLIRQRHSDGVAAKTVSEEVTTCTVWRQSDKWLRPTGTTEDAMLFRLGEVVDSDMDSSVAEAECKTDCCSALQKENSMLRQKVTDVQGALRHMTEVFQKVTGIAEDSALPLVTDPDEASYFQSYSSRDIHEEMLKDKVRTESYRDFMYNNKDLFKDKVVLDIGCGTGILSMFAARAGARRVVGIDMADIVDKAKEIVKRNELDSVITIIKGCVESVTLPSDIDKVDIIVSEWMGYFLLYESMLPTVLYARDKWLRSGGVVLPDKASMFVLGVEDPESFEKTGPGFWKDVYGFDMTPLVHRADTEEGVDEQVDPKKIISDVVCIKRLDMQNITVGELNFSTPFTLQPTRDGSIDAMVVYFDIGFEAGCENQVHFSTGPEATLTHWKQTVFYLRTPLKVRKSEEIIGAIQATRDRSNPRFYDVVFSFESSEEEFKLR
eukprot:80890_1